MTEKLMVTRVVGEDRYITCDAVNDLESGESISAVTFTPETGVTVASSAISGTQISGKFATPTAGKYRVDVALTTLTPGETIKNWFFINVVTPPST